MQVDRFGKLGWTIIATDEEIRDVERVAKYNDVSSGEYLESIVNAELAKDKSSLEY